jgi:hypothetical protein
MRSEPRRALEAEKASRLGESGYDSGQPEKHEAVGQGRKDVCFLVRSFGYAEGSAAAGREPWDTEPHGMGRRRRRRAARCRLSEARPYRYAWLFIRVKAKVG